MEFDKTYYLAALRREGAAFAAAAERGLEPDVPCCPGWSARDLLVHLGNVYEFWTAILVNHAQDADTDVAAIRRQLSADREKRLVGDAQQPAQLMAWFRGTFQALTNALETANSQERVYTWWPPQQNAGFIQRRMAHETAVHRWDMEQAHGCEQPIDSTLARDGVDEALDIHLMDRAQESAVRGDGESYHFHQTDGPGEWLVVFGPEGAAVSQEHAKADVAVRGTASDLLLFHWNRIPGEQLDVHGDVAHLNRFFELAPPE